MLPHRYELIRFHCESLGPSERVPACEDLLLVGRLESEEGNIVERTRTLLAYPRIMADPEQFPSVIAAELRSMMLDIHQA